MRDLSRIIDIEDLRRAARRRLPRPIFGYLDGGAEAEITLRENVRAFEEWIFRPRNASHIDRLQTRRRVCGTELTFPMVLAPIGYSRLMYPGAEIAAARAARARGITYALPTIAGHSIEEVRAAAEGPLWYQLYTIGGRAAVEPALERARKAGYEVLLVTIDTAVAGMRERDLRNGNKQLLGKSLWKKLPYLPSVLAHPGWLWSFWRDGGVPSLPNIVVEGKPLEAMDVTAALADAATTWDDLRWIRAAWPGPIVMKGVLTAEDARRAADAGAEGIVVSNHGGRQLDSVAATLRVLPEIVAAVGEKIEVLFDGGIRRGGDVIKALCLGARAVLLGRAYAYGMAAFGEAGILRALDILSADIERTLKLLGAPSIDALDGSFLQRA
ncbi:MAG: alpha-hydroxy-acid oxidizing protein [Deltaproteobacteria bacterium]|nr:MAG: alpha-hydroxy-acid oxidizing protein [Deltaproteobacteria bacterium]